MNVCYDLFEGNAMKKRSSKQIFVEALLELTKQKSVNKITVQQIVDESGLSLQTFYNHFLDKSDLILWVHKSKFEELLSKLGKNGYTYRDFTLENIHFYLDHKDYMWNVLHNTHGQDSYWRISADSTYRFLKDYIIKRHKLSELPEDIDFYLKVYAYSGQYMYAEWVSNMEQTSPEMFACYVEGAMPEALKKYLLD